MQPHIHESVPCRLVLQLRTYRCNAVNRRFGPMRLTHRSKIDLLDHLVGGGEQLIGNGEAERLCGLEIEHKLEFGRSLNGQIRGILTLENPIDIRSDLPNQPRREGP